MSTHLWTFQSLVVLVGLTALEVVLSIDNVVFISIIVVKLRLEEQARARALGISLAFLTRLALLFSMTWFMSLTQTVVKFFHHDFSGRDLVLLFGGFFLILKATHEIRLKLDGDRSKSSLLGKKNASFSTAVFQIAVIDIIFSIDSVVTAVGMAKHIAIVILAMAIAMGVVVLAAGAVGRFIERYPSIKMLALSFLLLIGAILFAEGAGFLIDKSYIYFAMGFALVVEYLNIRAL
jgi:predicted tellurium resistance membrane protein TerC